MSRIDAGFALVADKTTRNGKIRGQVDPVQDEPSGSDRRDLVVVNPKQTPLKPSRYADTLFLAHLFASKFDSPQTREKRRAEPADANASYRASAKRPVKPGRVLSKKI